MEGGRKFAFKIKRSILSSRFAANVGKKNPGGDSMVEANELPQQVQKQSKVETRNNKLITSFSTNHKNTPRSINTSLEKPVLHQKKFDFNTLESPERVTNPYKHPEGLIFKDLDSYLAK